jgi:hypothetical protein
MSYCDAYGIYYERKKLKEPCVLFRDYNGFWSPISSLYWSTSSRILVSRHPFSCIEEIISQFCPQCLSRYMEDEVRTSQNKCPQCFECPSCLGILNRSTNSEGKHILHCSGCNWQAALSSEIDNSNTSDLFNGIIKSLTEEETGTNSFQSFERHSDTGNRWKLADLEASLISKSTVLKHKNSLSSTSISPSSQVESGSELTTLAQRLAQPGLQQPLTINLPPNRMRLRTKRTLRCRRDVEEGKMSILVQPKMFPLEGDSSQKVQRGKWFVKDSSAIHEIPTIVITKLPNCDSIASGKVTYLHLIITNPKDYKMKVSVVTATSINESESPPFICKTEKLQTVGSESITFKIGAFEDELLRDADDDDVENTSEKDNNIEDGGTHSPETSQRGWSCTISHNVAHLIIGLKPASSVDTIQPLQYKHEESEVIVSTDTYNNRIIDPALTEKFPSVYVLPFEMTTEYGGDDSKTKVTAILGCKIAFPSSKKYL